MSASFVHKILVEALNSLMITYIVFVFEYAAHRLTPPGRGERDPFPHWMLKRTTLSECFSIIVIWHVVASWLL